MKPNDFRRLALAMDGAVEGSHMSHPDFRVNGRIFATIYPDNIRGMVQLTPDEQQSFVRDHPLIFEPASGAWGRGGSTTVHLQSADVETVGEAMTLAWQHALQKGAVTKRAAKKPPRRKAPVKSRR
jgi:hypothetical protein